MVLETLLVGMMLGAAPRSVPQPSYPVPQSVQTQLMVKPGRREAEMDEIMQRYGRVLRSYAERD